MKLSLVKSRNNKTSGILDSDLADFLGLKTKALNQAFKRSIHLHASDNICYQLTRDEFLNTLGNRDDHVKWGGRRYLPYIYSFEGACVVISRLRINLSTQQKNTLLTTFNKNDFPILDYGQYRFEESITHRLRMILKGILTVQIHYPVKTTSGNYYIDAYIKEIGLAIEIDEAHHHRRVEMDMARELSIKEVLSCEFMRVSGKGDIDFYLNKILKHVYLTIKRKR
ncbi:MAG: ORF6N domain-containing protein [Deltaproteobacteria bacterium]|nr:ORF6N domain-containing protein [Deltaproteobacteria bacterium]